MPVQIYINYNGNCREAVEFYAKVFGTDAPKIMEFGDGPPNPEFPVPEQAKHFVMHTQLDIGGSTIMFSDTFPGMPFVQGNNMSLTYMSKDQEHLKALFEKMKEGGKVEMELEATFWSKCYGSLTDKFGIPWQFSQEE